MVAPPFGLPLSNQYKAQAGGWREAMHFMSGLAASWTLRPLGPQGVTQALNTVLLAVLVTMNVALGKWLQGSGSPPS